MQPEFLGLTFDELEPGDCRYPEGDVLFRFCGQVVDDGSSYCPFHHRLACHEISGRRDPYSDFTHYRGVR